MHDGRFRTLDQVIEHYNWSVKPHRNLDPHAGFAANGLASLRWKKWLWRILEDSDRFDFHQ